MHKNELSRDRKKVVRPAHTAYALYARKASLRFEFEGRNETIRQLRAKVALCEAIGEHTMSEQIRGIVERVQAHQLDFAATLGRGAPDMIVEGNRPRDCGIDPHRES